MTNVVRNSAISRALAMIPANAFAQTTTVTTTTETRRPSPLSPDQRTVIYRTVTRERHVAPGPGRRARPAPAVTYEIGAPVPRDTEMYDFPEDAYIDTPELRRYRYVYVNNRLVLVDPATESSCRRNLGMRLATGRPDLAVFTSRSGRRSQLLEQVKFVGTSRV